LEMWLDLIDLLIFKWEMSHSHAAGFSVLFYSHEEVFLRSRKAQLLYISPCIDLIELRHVTLLNIISQRLSSLIPLPLDILRENIIDVIIACRYINTLILGRKNRVNTRIVNRKDVGSLLDLVIHMILM